MKKGLFLLLVLGSGFIASASYRGKNIFSPTREDNHHFRAEISIRLRAASPGREDDISWIDVKGGTFTLGPPNAARQITLRDFSMSVTEVTFAQYDAFCEATGKQKPDDNAWGRGRRPVINVSYEDSAQFCRWLSRTSGSEIRLPTEAEWEYAARGGQKSRGSSFSGGNDGDDVAWHEGNSGGKTQPVATKKPNELGLYDMTGNVWEWCSNADDPGIKASPLDSERTGEQIKRSARGNSFDNPVSPNDLFVSVRIDGDSRHYNLGFRIVKAK